MNEEVHYGSAFENAPFHSPLSPIWMVLTIVLFEVCACSKSEDQLTNPLSHSGLLTNGSFELNGQPSLTGWTLSASDTAFVALSAEAPPGGGSFSLRLKNEWSFPGFVSQFVALSPGTHRYELTASARAKRSVSPWDAGGDMMILIKQGSSWTASKSYHFSDTTWVSAGLTDTLTAVQGDTVEIRLRGNIDQFSFGYVYFDLITFEKLD
jgi:hypothetical protein